MRKLLYWSGARFGRLKLRRCRMNTNEFIYTGNELELFSRAQNWKRYWSGHVRQYLGHRVLEVGAGTGVNTPFLDKGAREWVCLEPDRHLAAILIERQ